MLLFICFMLLVTCDMMMLLLTLLAELCEWKAFIAVAVMAETELWRLQTKVLSVKNKNKKKMLHALVYLFLLVLHVSAVAIVSLVLSLSQIRSLF